MPDLDGKVAIVTGAGQGLGRGEAIELAKHGARVIVNDFSDAAPGVVEEIKSAGGEAMAHRGDVADWETARGLIGLAVETWGKLDILVNNAGFTRDNLLFRMDEDEFDTVVRVHLKGHFCMARHAAEQWRAQAKAADGTTYARCINTSSEAALYQAPGQPNYGPAKAGILCLSGIIAQTIDRVGGTSNAIAPRARTSMTEHQQWSHRLDGEFDLFAVENVTPLVAWLASPEAQHVSGQLFLVHARRIAVIDAPKITQEFNVDDRWTIDNVGDQLTPFFEKRRPVLDGIAVEVGTI